VGDLARLVVMASGSGSNLQALLDACARGDVPARVVGVVGDRPAAYALERARLAGVPAWAMRRRDCPGTREDFDRVLAEHVLAFQPDLVVLAGFMHVLSPAFLDCFPVDGIVNVHPSLLPDDPAADTATLPGGVEAQVFRGHDALGMALAAGVSLTGTCVHFVTSQVDRGPVLAREAVPILPGDTPETLRARVQAVEHRLLPSVLARVLRERGFVEAAV